MDDRELLAASRDEAAHFLRCAGFEWPTSEPAELTDAVAAIAAFRAMPDADEKTRARYESARLWLKHIAAGRLPLPTDDPVVEDEAHG